LSLQGTIVGAGFVVIAFATVAAVAGAQRRVVGALVAAGGVALAGASAYLLPPPEVRNLLPDQHFGTGRNGITLRGWVMFEADGANESVAVSRRGTARRLLANGRLEAMNGLATRSSGILSHLPLAIHASPERVLLIGLGNGVALTSALAHSTERVDCVARGSAFVEGATTFGAAVREGLDDGRVHLAIGDPEDLVNRAGRYDVILNQMAGVWGELASRLSTREFLEMVRDHLDDGGLYCQWLSGSALTKTGFQSLLATLASVFPQVEVWAGHGSSVLLLAKESPAPHDFGVILDAYRTPRIQASAADAWIPEPLSLLSYFLVSDEAVRRISSRATIHTRNNEQLGRLEAARRYREPTVNPVPGLSALGDDVFARLVNTPAIGFEAALVNAVQARAFERAGLLRDAERESPLDRSAVEIYENALQLNPRDRAIRRRLADLRSRMGIEFLNRASILAAHDNLRQAVEIDSTFAEGFANLGRHLAMTDEHDFAAAVTEHAIEMEPDNDLFALLLAQIWKRRVYYDKALPWYEKAMDLNPRNVDAAIGYVDTRLSMEANPDLEHGLEVSRRYLEFEPENEDLRSRIMKLELAISRREAGLELDPDVPPDTDAPEDSAAS
jgi:tetratricopeptide (TPR) repeat protein